MWTKRFQRAVRLTLPFVLVGTGGCDRDARLADRKLRDPKVRTVTHYGVTLDKEASPEQVVYVLLRAMRDDVLAETEADREAALDVQFDVSASGFLSVGHGGAKVDRLETLYRIVYHWTPTVSHYVGDIETNWERAGARFTRIGPSPLPNRTDGAAACEIMTRLADPGGDLNAAALLAIKVVQDGGYWRVASVAFEPRFRTLPPRIAAPARSTDSTSSKSG